MSILQFVPLGVGRTLRRAHRFFAHDPASAAAGAEDDCPKREKREAAVRFLNEVLLEEDTALCESIQQGLESRGYEQGRFVISPTDGWETEKSVAQFHALCHAHLAPSSA